MIVSPSHLPVGPDGQENEGQQPAPSVDNNAQNGQSHHAIETSDSSPENASVPGSTAVDSPPAAGTGLAMVGKLPLTPAAPTLSSALPIGSTAFPQSARGATTLAPSRPAAAVSRQEAAYDALRQRIAVQELRRKSLFLSSAGVAEGTTTTALSLARSLAHESSSVLLVELRFTAPHLRGRLKIPAGTPGLEEGLRGTVPLSDCLAKDFETSLSLLTLKQPMPAEEAAHKSGALNDFLEWAEGQFEWLILDCPPIASPDWTLWFDLNADPVLLVVRSGVTRQRAVQKASRRLKDRLAGAILFQP